MKENLLKKFLFFSIGGYINIIIGIFTVPIITRLFSPKEYGIFSLIVSIESMLLGLSYLGLDLGFMRFFYDEKEENRGRLLYETIFYPFFINLFISFFIFVFKKEISIFILGKIDNNLYILLIFYTFFNFLYRFAMLVIRMQQKAKLYSFFNTSIKIIEFISILSLYKIYNNTYRVLILSMIISLVLNTVLAIFIEKKIWTFKGKIETNKKILLKYSIPFTLTTILSWIFSSCDRILIKYFSSLEELGLYSGAFKIVAILAIIETGFQTFWAPVAYEHYSKNPKDMNFFKNVINYFSILVFSIGIGILLIKDLLILFLGKEYYLSVYIMPMLIFIPVMQLLSITTEIGIVLKKKTKYFIYTSAFAAVINVIGNFLLIPKLGAKGAAISTGIAYILLFFIKSYFSNKLIKIEYSYKKICISIFFMFIFAMILTFYNNIYLTTILGFSLEILLICLYFPIIKDIYSKYIKDFLINKIKK